MGGRTPRRPAIRAAAAAFCILLVGTAAFAAEAPSAEVLHAMILKEGPSRTVHRLSEGEAGRTAWDALMDRVASGDVAEIGVLPMLAPGADAGPAEDLGIALARALVLQPAAVLSVATGTGPLRLDRVCGLPFIEPTAEEIRAYRRRADRALDMVRATGLIGRRDACRATIKATGRAAR